MESMAERRLPRWMSGERRQDKKFTQAQQGLRKKNVIEDGLPYLEFAGTVIYSREKNDCSFLTEDLRSSLTPGSAVGFDMEWPPSFAKGETKKVALIQLCVSEDKCYLFHISSMSGFPSGLKMLLQDENIRKVGIGIEGDMWKLLSDFDVKLNNFLELTNLANEKLRCVEQWSLDGLVKHLFNKQLKKDKDVRCSQWNDFSLTEDQKRYAATDAYAGLIIYNRLENMNMESSVPQSGIKGKLLHMASELEALAGCIPEGACRISGLAELVEDMTVKVGTLRHSLMAYKHKQCTTNVVVDRQNLSEKKTLIPHSTAAIHQGSSDSEDVDHSSTDLMVPGGVSDVVEEVTKIKDYNTNLRKCIMSLDISEYELQMLEMHARQEDLVEQSTLEFQDQQTLNNSSDISCIIESDEELDNEMLQYVEELEKSSSQDQKLQHSNSKALQGHSGLVEDEEEDEGIEEEAEQELDPSIPVPNSEEIKCLKKYFGHSSFKPVQWKVIYSVLNERRDNLVVMATGYGKSLCFQFPPVYCGGISVVISPLIALMEDQVLQLRMSNIPACFLGSAQNENILANVKQGHYRVVYMTPEFCTGTIWLLEQLNNSVGLSLVAIDEAHCISEWGHDFRGAYRNLGNLRRTLGKVPILALTATASPSVREDIVKSLKLINPVVTCTSFDRPNIFLDVHYKSGNALQDLKQFLVKKGGLGEEYEFEGPTIVYCPSRKEAERVSAELYKLGILCGVYHAGLGVKQRRETQHRFMRDEIQCMVATVAFGMGINKADIRKVIHYGAPKEMESYYQEIGRAGRDGLPSACHVLWASGDMVLNRFLLNKVRNDRFRGYKIKMMAKMEQYLKSQRCRRKIILSHFEDKQLRKATSGIIGTSDCCDNCRSGAMLSYGREDSEPVLQDFGKEAYQLMTAVSVLDERFGITVPILFLRGSGSQRLPDLYRKHTLFGAGRSVSEAWWKALARKLIGEEYLTESMGQSRFATLCKLTPKGRKWLSKSKCETQCSLFLQPDSDLTTRIQVSRPVHTRSNFVSPRKPQSGLHTTPASGKVPMTVGTLSPRVQPLLPGSLLKETIAVSPRELELQEELYAKLVTGRQKLASEKDIPPAILATNKILLDMAKFRPCTVTSLRQVEGVSEAKSRMLEPLLQIITEFCQTHGLQAKVTSSSTSLCTERTGLVVSATSLPDSVAVTYRLFQEEGKSLRQVCDQRSLPLAVVESHLLQSFRAGCPLDTERAGLSALNRATITRIITSHPINSDLSNMKAIRALVPEDISSFIIQLTVAELQKTGVPTLPPSTAPAAHEAAPPVVKKEFTWIELENKPMRNEKGLSSFKKSTAKSDLEGLPLSDDELFSEISMPEESGPDRLEDVSTAKTLHSKAMELASWNQLQLDRDTQALFFDSSPKESGSKANAEPCSSDSVSASNTFCTKGTGSASRNQPHLDQDTQQQTSVLSTKTVSQPVKRKLPEWSSPTVPVSSATDSKKTKKKKGLFM